jgi:hypothetical protein
LEFQLYDLSRSPVSMVIKVGRLAFTSDFFAQASTKRVPFMTGGSLRSSGGQGYARLFLKLKKLEGNCPQTAQE